jgi:hypothetical protein
VRALFALLFLLVACAGEKNPSGLEEPLRVRGASFKDGALPSGASAAKVTFLETANLVLAQGQAGKGLSGRTSGASSVGLRFADLGSGYWVVVLGGPDPATKGELTFSTQLDVGTQLPPGSHDLQLVAFDGAGIPGEIRTLKVCVATPWPDNLNACDDSLPPPAAVLTLAWDANVDLDLQLLTPDGKLVDGKHPSTALPGDAGITKDDLAKSGRLDHDATCSTPMHRESIVWQTAPAPGTHLVYANLFDACGQGGVSFEATLLLNDGGKLVPKLSQRGQLLAIDANGGAKTGLYLTDLTFE